FLCVRSTVHTHFCALSLHDALPISLELDGQRGWCVARDAVLAEPPGVRRNPQWPGFAPLFGSDAGFLEYCSGMGTLVLTCAGPIDRKSTRLNSSHVKISYAVFCLKK